MAVIVDVAGANIGRDDTPAWAVHTQRAFQLLRRANQTRDGHRKARPRVAMVQEMNDDDRAPEWSYARHTFRGFDWDPEQHGPGSLVPVATPGGLDWKTRTRVEFLSVGEAKVSPDRFMSVRVTRIPGLDAPIGWASFQLVAGAFTNPGQPAEQYRRDAWHVGASAVEHALADLRADGITVVGSCDSNKPGAWSFAVPGFDRIVTHGLDMLWVVQGKGKAAARVDVRRSDVVPLPIDGHDLLTATLALA